MSLDFNQVITAEQKQAEQKQAELDSVLFSRRAAYLSESDPLRMEADYDGLNKGQEPDYSAWLASVAAIKARYPLPVVADSFDA